MLVTTTKFQASRQFPSAVALWTSMPADVRLDNGGRGCDFSA